MRTVYLGSSAFAVEVLKALAASAHRPELVVAPPDRPKGRGRRVGPPATASAARELGIELLQAESINADAPLAAIEASHADVVCVCEFGQLIKEPLLSRYLMLNVHPSLLPRWRGAAPIERAIMAGDSETGVTIFSISEALDAGPVALSAAEPVLPDDTAGTLSARLAALAGVLLVQALDRVEAGTLELVPQEEEGATYARKIGADERRLDPRRSAAELERAVRALTPDIGAYIALPAGDRLGVSAARVAGGALAPGELAQSNDSVLLGCGEGVLELVEVRPAGKRTMTASEYLRGHRLPERAEVADSG